MESFFSEVLSLSFEAHTTVPHQGFVSGTNRESFFPEFLQNGEIVCYELRVLVPSNQKLHRLDRKRAVLRAVLFPNVYYILLSSVLELSTFRPGNNLARLS